jgi:ribosomal protein L37AE/L43A
MILMKPWNPYIFRHSALTEKSQILKESTLRDHAGWTYTSKMPQVYLHYFGNESSNSLLEAYGVKSNAEITVKQLRPKQCPNCNEPNKPESKFCMSCSMVMSYDAYNETMESKRLKDQDIGNLRVEMTVLKQIVLEMQNFLRHPKQVAELSVENL